MLKYTVEGKLEKGSGGRRTGTTRHDNGHAADVQLKDQQVEFWI